MKNNSGKVTVASILTITAFVFGAVLFNSTSTSASAVEKIVWCHVEPNGNSQTLDLPASSLQNAGHMDASGNPLHAGDHSGACATTQPTATPTVAPTMTPTATATATTQPTVTPTATPDDCAECNSTPTPTPTATPSNGDVCANIEGIQLSLPDDSYHFDNDRKNCLQFSVPGVDQPNNPGTGIGGAQVLGASTVRGQVLGASTMAGTGAVEDAIFNSIFTLGSLLTSFGIMKNGKKKA